LRWWLATFILQDMNTADIKTRAVAAASYAKLATFHNHAVDTSTGLPLCKRVKPASILDDCYAVDDENAPATCPVCAKRDPRFK
jgi:hypothetical protein